MKLRYIGKYAGSIPWLRRNLKPGDEIEVSEEQGKKLLSTRQFESITMEGTLTEVTDNEGGD